MAQKYCVSRKTAREAALRLRGFGVLQSRKRKGLLVADLDPVKLLSTGLPSIANSSEGLIELGRLRYVIEIGAIELAVKKATEEQICKLEDYAWKFEEIVKGRRDDEAQNDIELEFHGLILKMTGSSLIARLQEILARFFALSTNSGGSALDSGETVWQHRELVRAIREKDLERARAMMRLQFRDLLEEAT